MTEKNSGYSISFKRKMKNVFTSLVQFILLNLVGKDCTEVYDEAMTFFEICAIKCLISSAILNPQWWRIVNKDLPVSRHKCQWQGVKQE